MNATFAATIAALHCLGAALLLAPAAAAKPVLHKPAASRPAPAAAATNPAVALVQRFLDLRAGGRMAEAYSLFFVADQKKMTQTPEDAAASEKILQDDALWDKITAGLPKPAVAYMCLFSDSKNLLKSRFRVLGATQADPRTVRVRFYRLGKPLTDIAVMHLVTRPDPDAGNALRINGRLSNSIAFNADDDRMQPAQAVSRDNLSTLALAVLKYTFAHNYHYPDADRWMDEIMPYVKQIEPDATEANLYHDPAAPDGQTWSYAFNRNLSGKTFSGVKAHDKVVLLFESNLDTKNASDEGQSRPAPGWHGGGTDYAAASGDIAWVKDGTLWTFSPDGPPRSP